MAIGKTWYSLDEAAEKLCLEKAVIEQWIAEGVIRTEEDDETVRLNIDDLELKLQE